MHSIRQDDFVFSSAGYNNSIPTSPAHSHAQLKIVVLVAIIHAIIFIVSVLKPSNNVQPPGEMSVQVTVLSKAPQAALQRKIVKAEPVPEEKSDTPNPPAQQQVSEAEQPVAAQAASGPVLNSTSPEMVDVEPDYKATYLNNPKTVSPIMARRHGLQGAVLLNVEVLENGLSGQISILKSSGYEVLDNAALQAVKSWRFVPARQGGRPITRQFKIPIVFSLN